MIASWFHRFSIVTLVVLSAASPARADLGRCFRSFFAINKTLEPKFLVRYDNGINMQVTSPTAPGFRLLDIPYKLFRGLLGVDGVSKIHQAIVRDKSDLNVFQKAEKAMDLKVEVDEEWLKRVPKSGPIVITANHSLSGVDGIALAAAISRVRPDVKIMLNKTFSDMKVLEGRAIFANPIDPKDPANLTAIRESMAHLKDGGVLIVFPAGEVSGQKTGEAVARDPEWMAGAAKLAQKTGAHVIPAFVAGQPSDLFLAARRQQPFLATALILREMSRLKGATIPLHFGEPIPPGEVKAFKTAQELNDHLRAKTYALAGSVERARGQRKAPPDKKPGVIQPIMAPVDPVLLAKEISGLPPETMIGEDNGLQIFVVRGDRIPHAMNELGRLREEAFRDVGEGSGKASDTDEYDQYYSQLFIWDKAKGKIAGGYRLGLGDQILKERGLKGFYNSQFFDLKNFMEKNGSSTIELGRSFVALEYQKTRALALIWKGLCEFVARNPTYTSFVGPVSMSRTYETTSRQLMAAYLQKHHGGDQTLVQSLNAPKFESPLSPAEVDTLVGKTDGGIKPIFDLVEEIDGVAAPMLFKQYLKWDGKFLAFYDDPAFNSMDGFIHVDLLKTNPATMNTYFGKESHARYREFHGLPPLAKRRGARGEEEAPKD